MASVWQEPKEREERREDAKNGTDVRSSVSPYFRFSPSRERSERLDNALSLSSKKNGDRLHFIKSERAVPARCAQVPRSRARSFVLRWLLVQRVKNRDMKNRDRLYYLLTCNVFIQAPSSKMQVAVCQEGEEGNF